MKTASSSQSVVLITGGAGFIGSHVAEYFAARGKVRILDSLRTGRRSNLEGIEVEWVEGSILDRPLVREAVQGVDSVVHLAAVTSVPESMKDPIDCEEVNVKGLLTVLEESAQAGVKRLCFSSSAAVYGDDPSVPKTETMRPQPRSPYAITKLAGEYYCELFRREGLLNAVSLRLFNVYGPRQDPNSAYAAAIPAFAARALKDEPISIFGDGKQTRDFVCVRDIVGACAHMLEHPEVGGVFNVGMGKATSICDLAVDMISQTGSASRIEYEAARAGDVLHSTASIERLRQAGFTPQWDLPRGLAETLSWYRAKSGRTGRQPFSFR